MKKLAYFLVLGSALVLAGCVTRTYSVTKDRVDQDLASGNRGFIAGTAPAETTARPTERTIRVFEVEFGKSYKAKQENAPLSARTQEAAMETEYSQEASPEPSMMEPAAYSGPSQKYTVGKNDTLQKISRKFYGTTKKWTKIYDANRDILKGPDKVYPGQELTIPDAPESAAPANNPDEPKENLK